MMLAGKKILKDLGYDEPKPDQPRVSLSPDTPFCAGCGTLWLDTTAIGSEIRGYVPNCQCKKTGILIGIPSIFSTAADECICGIDVLVSDCPKHGSRRG